LLFLSWQRCAQLQGTKAKPLNETPFPGVLKRMTRPRLLADTAQEFEKLGRQAADVTRYIYLRVTEHTTNPFLLFTTANGLNRMGFFDDSLRTFEQTVRTTLAFVEYEPFEHAERLLAESLLKWGDGCLRLDQLTSAQDQYEAGTARPVTEENAEYQTLFHARLGYLAAQRGDAAGALENLRKSLQLRHELGRPAGGEWLFFPDVADVSVFFGDDALLELYFELA